MSEPRPTGPADSGPRPTAGQIFLAALRLGCTSFGGPVAHLAYFREDYVRRRGWLDDASYADLVALCQFLPGPASSQAGFAIGWRLRGAVGGLAAWLGFTLPSAVLMIACGYGVATAGQLAGRGWVAGLQAAALAVVTHAAVSMWTQLAPDLARSLIASAATGFLLLAGGTGAQVAVLAAGAAIGAWWLPRSESAATGTDARPRGQNLPVVALATFIVLLVALPLLALATRQGWLVSADCFYRTGSLVFGGGHVVLPLLEQQVVGPGWIDHERFLAGYGAAQALPGPLFTFAGFLGAAMKAGPGGWVGGLWAVAWIFLPGLLLVAGCLPHWERLRRVPRASAAMRGANAAVLGLLLAGLLAAIASSGLRPWPGGAVALAALVGLQIPRIPVWILVAGSAALGAALG